LAQETNCLKQKKVDAVLPWGIVAQIFNGTQTNFLLRVSERCGEDFGWIEFCLFVFFSIPRHHSAEILENRKLYLPIWETLIIHPGVSSRARTDI